MTNSRNTIGLLLIGLGVLVALSTFGLIDLAMHLLWPFFLLVPAALFHFGFFLNPRQEMAGLLVPGGILGTLGLIFLINNLLGGDLLGVLWPLIILAPAVGLYELYYFGGRNAGLLIPIAILAVVATVFLGIELISSLFGGVFGLVLVIVGLYLIFSGNKGRRFF